MATIDDATEVSADWRKSGVDNGHSKRFANTLESGYLSDVVFIVGNDKIEIKAHKLVLSIGSKVFAQLFSDDNEKSSFEVPDLDPEVFSRLLKFLYTGESTESIADGLPLLSAAAKYEISDLVRICGELLSGELNYETALRLFQQALKYKEPGLEERAMKCICSNGSKIVESAEFLELRTEELGVILERDDLQVKDELQLFRAVMNWGRAECKRLKSPETHKYMRSVLEKVIYLIRFPLMDPSDFSLHVASTQILLNEEVTSVLLYFNVKPARRAEVSNGIFNSKPRIPYTPTGTKLTLHRLIRKEAFVIDLNTKQSTGLYYIPTSAMEHSIRFKCRTSIWVTSLGMNCTFPQLAGNCTDTLPVQIQLKDADNKILAVQNEVVTGIRARIIGPVHHVQFKEPVYLREDEWYTASFTHTAGTFYGASYVPLDGVGTYLDFDLQDGSERVIKFEFENADNLKYTGITQGFIPEIGFMVE